MGQTQTKNKNKNKALQKFESKEEYFIKNGGILLEKQIALSHGQYIVGQLKLLSEDDIKNATNNYDPNLIASRSPEANVYKGKLDDRLVYIKTLSELEPNPDIVDLFLSEVSTIMVLRHDHMSRIYGCCLETYIPIIVYQYVRSEKLDHYLHGNVALERPMKWSGRLTVATDVAYVLSYMHNALLKPTVHRDVKSYGILVDSSLRATLVNVAHSVSITPGKKDQRCPVHGTPGYIDPEYIETQEVTDKCDVYSFGVLMLELLTAREPIEMARRGKDLVIEVVSEVEGNGCVEEIVDSSVLGEGNMGEIISFARLALKCVAKKGEERPTMISVVEELWHIQDQQNNRCGSNI